MLSVLGLEVSTSATIFIISLAFAASVLRLYYQLHAPCLPATPKNARWFFNSTFINNAGVTHLNFATEVTGRPQTSIAIRPTMLRSFDTATAAVKIKRENNDEETLLTTPGKSGQKKKQGKKPKLKVALADNASGAVNNADQPENDSISAGLREIKPRRVVTRSCVAPEPGKSRSTAPPAVGESVPKMRVEPVAASTERSDNAPITKEGQVSFRGHASRTPRALSETPQFSGVVRRVKAIRGEKEAKPTAWFEDRSIEPPVVPPSASELPNAVRGDLFFHNGSAEAKFWILQKSDGQLAWKSILIGYRRSDGRRLSLTKTRGEPSWIGDMWFRKRMSRDATSAPPAPLGNPSRSTPATHDVGKNGSLQRAPQRVGESRPPAKKAKAVSSDEEEEEHQASSDEEEAQETPSDAEVESSDDSFHKSSSSE